MSHKGFHPARMDNQKKVWMAEQKEKEERERLEQRRKELEMERATFVSSLGDETDKKTLKYLRDKQSLSFMYKQPEMPNQPKKKESKEHPEED